MRGAPPCLMRCNSRLQAPIISLEGSAHDARGKARGHPPFIAAAQVRSRSKAKSAPNACISPTNTARVVRIDTSLVLLHQGVIPSTQLPRSLGCEHEWDASPVRCWRPRTDAHGRRHGRARMDRGRRRGHRRRESGRASRARWRYSIFAQCELGARSMPRRAMHAAVARGSR